MKKRLIISLMLLLFLSTYNIQDSYKIGSQFTIKKIIVENNSILDEEIIKKELTFLYDANLFFLRLNKIKINLENIDFIKSFEVKKIYPNKIKIKIFEKKPIAVIQYKKEKKYFTEDGDVIKFVNLEDFDNLPLVFGDYENFRIFQKSLKNINFPFDQVKKFYFFESKRWDLVTTRNQTIKLPTNNYEKSLKNFINLKEQANFEKYKTFDYRITGQLILK